MDQQAGSGQGSLTENGMTANQELLWVPEMVGRFWAFEQTRPENFFSHQVGRVLVRHFRKCLKGRVLDYGCGLGFLMDDMLKGGISCGGVEFTSDFTSRVNAAFGGRQGFLGVRTPDDFADWRGTFDAIFLVEVIEHLYDDELQKALANIHDLLRRGGVLIVTTPNNEDRSKNFLCSPESGRLFHRFQHVRSWSRESLSACLKRHGFAVSDVGETDFSAHVDAFTRTRPFSYRLVRTIAKKLNPETPHLYGVAAKVEVAVK